MLRYTHPVAQTNDVRDVIICFPCARRFARACETLDRSYFLVQICFHDSQLPCHLERVDFKQLELLRIFREDGRWWGQGHRVDSLDGTLASTSLEDTGENDLTPMVVRYIPLFRSGRPAALPQQR